MSQNYTYIIASLPALSPSWVPSEGSCKATLDWMASQLDKSDRKAFEFVTGGFTAENLTQEFYTRALASRNRFIKAFFSADLAVRNAKVAYLNRMLERPEGTDMIQIPGFEYADRNGVDEIFKVTGLLERERAIDNYLWARIDEETLFEYFSLDKVLSLAAKMCIIERWLALDPETGRLMLARMTEQVRGSYGKIEFDKIK